MINWQDIFGYNGCEKIHTHVLEQLPDGATVIELGVAYGRGIAMLVDISQRLGKRFRIVGVDRFVGKPADIEAGYTDMSLEDTVRKLTKAGASPDQYEIIVGDSADTAKLFNSVHYVFVDADHHEELVLRDILAWWPKVVVGGFIGGHDWEFLSVRHAVGSLFPNAEQWDYDNINSWLQRKT